MQVLLPALRSDLASIPLPSDSLQPASPAPLTDQCMDSHPMALTSHHLRRTGHSTAATTAPPAVHKHGRPGNQASSQQSSAVSTCFRLGAEAAESTSASRPPATPDNVPILPLNTQTAMGSCVSPKVGRRTTPFSTSEPSHQSVPESRQDTAATAAVLQHDSLMQDATVASTFVGDVQESSVDSQQDTAMQAASNATADECHGSCGEPEERSDGCRHRSYLTCCVRLSVEKEPHR